MKKWGSEKEINPPEDTEQGSEGKLKQVTFQLKKKVRVKCPARN